MLVDHLTIFSQCLQSYLMDDSQGAAIEVLMKRHDENFVHLGDFSFPNSAFLSYQVPNYGMGEESTSHHVSLAELFAQKKNEIVEISSNWILPVADVIEFEGRSYVYLKRAPAFTLGITEILFNMDIVMNRILTCNTVAVAKNLVDSTNGIVLGSFIGGQTDLTYRRTDVFAVAVHNLCSVLGVQYPLLVTADSTAKSKNRTARKVICIGPVLNAETGELEENLKLEDYVHKDQKWNACIVWLLKRCYVEVDCQNKYMYIEEIIRRNEIKEKAISRYGSHYFMHPNSADILQLGESATTFELLLSNATAPMSINFTSNSFDSGGPIYTLYNCARVETVLEVFEMRVRGGMYPPLPDHNEINFVLLEEEDEWSLMFNFVLGLSAALSKCVEFQFCEQEIVFRPHYLCNYVAAMMRVFDSYYSTTDILLIDPTPDMLPLVYARIHLLKAVSLSFQICLRILHIEPVKPMPQ